MKKKILLLTTIFILGLTGCSKTESVEDWQKAENFGEIDESVEIDELYEWGVVSEDLLIDKYINIETKNTYRDISMGVLKATWNYYADNNLKIVNVEEESYGSTVYSDISIKDTNVKDNTSIITMKVTEKDGIITKADILLPSSMSEENLYKYTILSYYIFIPQASKTQINNAIQDLHDETNLIQYTSNKRDITINKVETMDSFEIKIVYNYIGEQ